MPLFTLRRAGVIASCLLIFFLAGLCLLNHRVPDAPPSPPRLTPRYTVTDVGLYVEGYASEYRNTALSQKGEVFGQARQDTATEINGNTLSYVALWHNGKIRGLHPLIASECQLSCVNEKGQLVGGYGHGDMTEFEHGFLWSGGKMTDLGTLGGRHSVAYGINNKGQVVGVVHMGAYMSFNQAFLWQKGRITDLSVSSGTSSSMATNINDQGQIVGSCADSPCLWQNGKAQTLHSGYGQASAINNKGQIIGTFSQPSDSEAFLWEKGRMQYLGKPFGYDPAAIGGVTPTGINEKSQVVGFFRFRGLRSHQPFSSAFLWQSGKMEDLNSIISASAGWTIDSAFSINNAGQILAVGHRKGQVSGACALLLTPMAPEHGHPL